MKRLEDDFERKLVSLKNEMWDSREPLHLIPLTKHEIKRRFNGHRHPVAFECAWQRAMKFSDTLPFQEVWVEQRSGGRGNGHTRLVRAYVHHDGVPHRGVITATSAASKTPQTG